MSTDRPGSAGEHELQERYGTFKRAAAFYDKQMLDHLNPLMREYLARQEMVFIATADASGECDSSFRSGPPGFVRVLDDRTVIYPEYAGNGVMASLGNITENRQIGMVFVDFFHSAVGLHINGRASIVERDAVDAFGPMLARMAGVETLHDAAEDSKKVPERWVLVDVIEAYIHCSKHIPLLAHLPGDAGRAPAAGDYFKAKNDDRSWTREVFPAPVAEPQRAPAEAVASPPRRKTPRPDESTAIDQHDTLTLPAWVSAGHHSSRPGPPRRQPSRTR